MSRASETPSRPLAHQPALDGLRALSVLGVLLFHGQVDWLPGGFLGVSAFFTLSGFLIGSLLLRALESDGRIDFARFWVRRFRRLMPAALAGIALAALVTLATGSTEARASVASDGLAALFYVSNWYFWRTGRPYAELFVEPSALQHYWSLSIEEQFYLGLPLLLAGLAAVAGMGPRRTVSIAVGIGGLLGLSLAVGALGSLRGFEQSRLYYGTDVRAAELLVGVLLALWLGRHAPARGFRAPRSPRLVQLGGVIGLVTMLGLWGGVEESTSWLYSGGLFAHALATALLIRASISSGPLGAALAWAPLVWLGRISYGVYLYHWPIFIGLRWAPDHPLASLELPIETGLTLLFASLSYRFLEEPIRRGRRLVGRRGGWVSAFAVSALALALLAVPAPRPTLVDQYTRTLEPMKAGRDRERADRILLVGDSLTVSLFFGFERWAERRDDVYVVATGQQCSLAIAHARRTARGWRDTPDSCRDWVDGFGALTRSVQPDVVLVLSAFWDLQDARFTAGGRAVAPGDAAFDAWLLEQLAARVDALASTGARVLWLTAPCPGVDHLRPALRRFDAIQPNRFAYLNRDLLPRLVALRPSTLALLDLDAHVCPDGRFATTIDGVEEARPDGLHFSADSAERLADWLHREAGLRERAERPQ